MLSHRVIITAFALFIATLINAQTTNQHVVMRGETFASIANKYGITEQQLKNANSAHSTCHVGLKLTIPAAKEKKSIAATSPAETKQGATTTSQTSNAISSKTYAKENNKAAKKEKRREFWEKFRDALDATSETMLTMSERFYQMGGNASSKPTNTPKAIAQIPQSKDTDDYTETIEKKDDGGFIIHQITKYGSTSSDFYYSLCNFCKGTIICYLCKGRGVSMVVNRMEKCNACMGERRCTYCSGEKYPGYRFIMTAIKNNTTGELTFINFKGEIHNANLPSSTSSTFNPYDNQGSDNRYQSVVCDNCYGTGMTPKTSLGSVCGLFPDKCFDIACTVCGRRHCSHLQHEKCAKCDGARQVEKLK